jgi:LPPG:FO 2-phospho-L-lactate transferase
VVTGPAPVVGISPIIGGAPVRGMADRCLATLEVECSAAGVGALYGARSAGGLLDGWLVDTSDASADVPGVPVHSAPLWMKDEVVTEEMVHQALVLAGGFDA